MRKIKFRAWDESTKKFVEDDEYGILLCGDFIKSSDCQECGGYV